jgi:hypothetical protein
LSLDLHSGEPVPLVHDIVHQYAIYVLKVLAASMCIELPKTVLTGASTCTIAGVSKSIYPVTFERAQ